MTPTLPDRHYLTPLFEPESVAIIGASERKGAIGTILIENMKAARYRGALFAVNPKHRTVQGVPCFPVIGKVPQRIDLAVIATPPQTVPQLMVECGQAGVRVTGCSFNGGPEIGRAHV